MQFDYEFEIPLTRADARVLVRMGGRPVQEYAVMLQVQLAEHWRTIRLVDNHLDQHHLHRYDNSIKQQPGEHFAVGEARAVLPQAIRHLIEAADSIIDSWNPPQ